MADHEGPLARREPDELALQAALAPQGFRLKRPRKPAFEALAIALSGDTVLGCDEVFTRVHGAVGDAELEIFENQIKHSGDSTARTTKLVGVVTDARITGLAKIKSTTSPWVLLIAVTVGLALLPLFLLVMLFQTLAKKPGEPPKPWITDVTLGFVESDKLFDVGSPTEDDAKRAAPRALQEFVAEFARDAGDAGGAGGAGGPFRARPTDPR